MIKKQLKALKKRKTIALLKMQDVAIVVLFLHLSRNQLSNSQSIKTLIENDVLVIAAGGGGVPVIREQHDSFKGVDAVIDKR